MKPTIAELAEHVAALCRRRGIAVHYVLRIDDAVAVTIPEQGIRDIFIVPVRSHKAYMVALHEIGHIAGRYQRWHHRSVTREKWAWEWARRNALLWTKSMEASAQLSMIVLKDGSQSKLSQMHRKRLHRKIEGHGT